MRRCKHEALVELSAAADPCLVDPHRLRRLIESLPNPEDQTPLIIAYYGTQEKRMALSQLFPANDSKTRDRRPAMCKIYTDAITSHHRNPIFFADIDPDCGPPSQETIAHCHQFQAYRISPRPYKIQINHMLMNCLLLPFTDLICIFADDLGGLAVVKQHLQHWADSGIEAAPQQQTTRVVIIISSPSCGQIDDFWVAIRDSCLDKTFPEISFEILSGQAEDNVRYIPLRVSLLQEKLGLARQNRQNRMQLFSGPHLAALFSQCLAHIATNPLKPFQMLQASRQGIPQPPDFSECVAAFLKATYDQDIPY